MYELPPILSGSPAGQTAQLREYLLRLVRSLEETRPAETSGGVRSASSAPAGAGVPDGPLSDPHSAPSVPVGEGLAPPADSQPASSSALPEGFGRLRSLVVKTADTLTRRLDTLGATLRADYLAVSDFGVYREQIAAEIAATARQIVESYDFLARLDALDGELGALDSAVLSLQGQIRRGLVTDPETGQEELGVAIGQQLRFTGATRTENGLEYQELSPGQTLGLYTSRGWQYWIGGVKRGWFDSEDAMLHVRELAATQSVTLGGGWLMTADNGFGLRAL